MKIEYYILNPTENITAFVTTKVSPCEYVKCNNEIMKKHPEVEQVGFVDFQNDKPYLRMCGGEFCGNATMACAVLYCYINDICDNDVFVSVYGIKAPIKVTVKKYGDTYLCDEYTEKPKCFEIKNFIIENKDFALPIVDFLGISHIIANIDFDTKTAEKILRKYAKKFNIPAIGMMLYDDENNKLLPIVYVKECDTLFYERSCASGSLSLAFYLSQNDEERREYIFNEPGGTLKVFVDKADGLIRLSGNVVVCEHFTDEI